MKTAGTILLTAGVLAFSASLNPPRAGDIGAPGQNAAPLGQARKAAKPIVTTVGEPHVDVLGKQCLSYVTFSRPHLVNTSVFDYVVSVTNKCPVSIRLRICQKDGSGCNRAFVQARRSQDVAMGAGPLTDRFEYIAKEAM